MKNTDKKIAVFSNYKPQSKEVCQLLIKKRLEITAKIAYQLDEEMGKIRDDIQEAQALFDPISRKLNDGVGNSDDTDEEYR